MTLSLASIRAPRKHHSPAHVPALDGVRGVAILMVLVHHFFSIDDSTYLPAFRTYVSESLFIGVDLFLVLSGFLITRILLATKNDPHYFRNFYARRSLRIFPLYYAYLAAIALIACVGAKHDFPLAHYVGSRTNILWAAVYLTNVLITVRGAWISPFFDPLWSLAVEEHFYLVWPMVVRWTNPRRLLWLCAAIISATLLARILVAGRIPHTTLYALTCFRLDALAAGAGLAALLHLKAPTPLLRTIAFVVLGAAGTGLVILEIMGPGLGYHDPQLAVWLFPLVTLFFVSAVTLVVTRPQGFTAKVLSLPAFRFFGKYSYCLYLVHLPIWVALDPVFEPGNFPHLPRALVYVLRAATAMILSIVLALVSWNGLEKRFLRLKSRFA